MLHKIILFFQSFRNILDYPLRQLFHWRRKGLRIKNEPKEGLFSHLSEPDRLRAQTSAARLLENYHLERLFSSSSRDNYRENLYYLSMLESAFNTINPPFPDCLAAADIGSSHWFYVQALFSALKWWQAPSGRKITLTGFEGDAYRVYSDFHSRYDHALAHIGGLADVAYKPIAFFPQPATFDIITLFFPFIFLPDHLAWGLPSSLFDPSTLFKDAWLSLKPGGLLIIANQGEAEQQQQLELLNQAHIPVNVSFPFDSMLYQYDTPRFITIARHEHESHIPG